MSEIEGMAALRAQLATIKAHATDLRPALESAAAVVLKSAKDRIAAGGPGWPPNTAGTPLLHRSGRLLSSLEAAASGVGFSLVGGGTSDTIVKVDGNSVTVGTAVPYAKYLQDGTGIYGASGRPITAKNGGALAFMLGGRSVIVKSVKGTPSRPFLLIDSSTAEKVGRLVAAYVIGESK